MRTLWGVAMACGLQAAATAIANAQDYPSKPIRIYTAPAGGGTDFTARLVAQGITGALGQPLVIDNRPLFPAVEAAPKSAPDGYALLVQGISLWVAPLMQNAPYDAIRDLAPITLVEKQASVLAVHPSVPVKTVKELIALAKAHPGELNYSTGVRFIMLGTLMIRQERFALPHRGFETPRRSVAQA